MSSDGERLRGIRDDVPRIDGGDIRHEARSGLSERMNHGRCSVCDTREGEGVRGTGHHDSCSVLDPRPSGHGHPEVLSRGMRNRAYRDGIQECLRLAKIYVKSEQDRVFDETAQPYDEIDWAKFEKQLERL